MGIMKLISILLSLVPRNSFSRNCDEMFTSLFCFVAHNMHSMKHFLWITQLFKAFLIILLKVVDCCLPGTRDLYEGFNYFPHFRECPDNNRR